ncbi:hypothetical protein CVS28_17240 [Arthrobacter glacialis]|nr:hypothetical protein CVS28_17240 [Arthrobacter glacialis]
MHFLKKSEPDSQYVKINLETGESEGALQSWANQKQLKKIKALIVKHHELFEGWWQKNHGDTVAILDWSFGSSSCTKVHPQRTGSSSLLPFPCGRALSGFHWQAVVQWLPGSTSP